MIGAAGACLAGLPVKMSQVKACGVNAALSSIAPFLVFILYRLDSLRLLLGSSQFLISWMESFAAGAALYLSVGILMPLGRQQHPALALQLGLLVGFGTLLLSGASTLLK